MQIRLKRKYLHARNGRFGAVGDHQLRKRGRSIGGQTCVHTPTTLVLVDGRKRVFRHG